DTLSILLYEPCTVTLSGVRAVLCYERDPNDEPYSAGRLRFPPRLRRSEFDNPHQHVTGFRYNRDSYYYDAKRNYEEAVAWYRAHEWQFNKGRTDAPPALCLALSGGGSRAATFGLGVMERLEELKTLQRVDVISGASGGAYLMSWFYAQHLN